MIPGVRSAFATAESSTFTTGSVAPSGENFNTRRASSTCRPRMSSIKRLAFVGETRRDFAVALASIRLLLQRRASLGVVPVRAEDARRRELPELVADHRLGDVHRHMLASVVHRDRVPDHVRHDRGAPRPGADYALVAALVHVRDLDHQVLVDERTLLDRPRHQPRPFPRRRMIILLDALFLRRVRPSFLPHGDVGWRPPELLPSPPPSGWSTGFIATPRVCGRTPFQRLRPALPIFTRSASALPTSPTVPRQSIGTRRISVLGRRRVANWPSLATSCTLVPAPRAMRPP